MTKKSKFIGTSIVILLLVIGYLVADHLLFDGVKMRTIQSNEFRGYYFAQEQSVNQPAVILLGGGNAGSYWGQELAKANYVGLSLPYMYEDGLPNVLEEIELDYFKKAILWLRDQKEVNPNSIILMGASRNAELALLLGAYFPDLVQGVIAYAPSSVSWPNTVMASHSEGLKASWLVQGKAIPFMPMAPFQAGKSDTVATLTYWQEALKQT